MIALYVRVSTAEQAKEGYSIDEQTERLKLYCEAHGRKDYVVYTDAGMSGANMQRAGLQAVIADAKAGKLDKVLVYKLDRLSRSQKDTLFLIEDAFISHGVEFESMTERFDTGTSFGRAMVGILAVFAQLEREQIKERMMLGKEGRAKSGKYHGGGKKPIGYEMQDKALIVNEYEAAQVREAFERYVNGQSVKAIVDAFNGLGYVTSHGRWCVATLYHILENPLYKGVIKSGGQQYAGAHVPIISEELFNRAQIRRQKRGGKQTDSYASTHALLGGRVWCKRCGERFGVFSTKARGKIYLYYSCYAARKLVAGHTCDNDHIQAAKLEAVILGEIQKLEIDADYIRQLSSAKREQDKAQAQTKAIAKELEKIAKQRERLIDIYTVEGIDKETLTQRAVALNKRETDLRAQLQALKDKAPRITPKQAERAVKGFADILARGNHAEIMAIIDELIDRVEIDRGEVFIHWNFI